MSQLEHYLLVCYGALLRLYPSRFSMLFAEEMYAVFAVLVSETIPHGWLALLQLVLKEFGGVTMGFIREHVDIWRTLDMNQRFVQSLVTAISIGCLAFLVMVALFLDFAVAAPTLRIVSLLIVGALGMLLGILLYLSHRRRLALIGLVFFVMLNTAIWTVDWNSRKPFARDFYQIHVGMTMPQVDKIMAPYMRLPVSPGTMAGNKTVGYRHTTEGWGDSDIGLVRYDADGYVRDIVFLPD